MTNKAEFDCEIAYHVFRPPLLTVSDIKLADASRDVKWIMTTAAIYIVLINTVMTNIPL